MTTWSNKRKSAIKARSNCWSSGTAPCSFVLISRLVRDEHLAHDVLQHVFLQLYRSLPTLVPGGTLKAWLSQVARHCSIDELRRRRHLLFSEIEPFPEGGEYSFLATLPDPDRQPEEQVELRELRQLLLEAIETLPSHYRAVVLLRYDTQLSYREIGRALRIPETTAKTYFYRARKQLRNFAGVGVCVLLRHEEAVSFSPLQFFRP